MHKIKCIHINIVFKKQTNKLKQKLDDVTVRRHTHQINELWEELAAVLGPTVLRPRQSSGFRKLEY